MKVAIYGASGHGKVIWEILEASHHSVVGFVDDHAPHADLLGLPVTRHLKDLPAHDAVIVAIGNNRIRKAKFEELKAEGRQFVNAIHPSAILTRRLHLGTGIVIAAGVILNIDTVIGDNAIINTGATLDHDNHVGNHAHIAPGCHLAGAVHVGEGAFLGIGTIAIPGVTIGAWSSTGANTTLIRPVPPDTTVVGSPGRPIKG